MAKYVVVKTIDEALDFLGEYGADTKIIAGGTDIILLVRDGKSSPRYLLDITNISSLDYIHNDSNSIKIGALVTHSDVTMSPIVIKKAAVLAEASAQVGSPQVRNMGTLVGNVINASPAADAALALVALDAEASILSKQGRRTAKVSDLFVGPGKTDLDNKELVTELTFPELGEGKTGAFMKLGQRCSLAISVVNVAAVITADKGLCQDAKIAIGASAPTPLRAREAERALIGHPLYSETISEAALKAASEVSPIDDIRGCVDYRCQMTRVLVARAITAAVNRLA